MPIFVTRTSQVDFQSFLDRYCAHIETRILEDVEISSFSKTHENLRSVFGYLRRMKVHPLRFLDYSFQITDGIPIPQKLQYYLKRYEEADAVMEQTIYEIIDDHIQIVSGSNDNLMMTYLDNDIYPFLPAYDDSVKLYVYQRSLPKEWIIWDDDLIYYYKVKAAMVVLKQFSKMKEKLERDWLPVLYQKKDTV